MSIEAVSTLITNVGFPIACCCVMFYQNSKLQETLHDVTLTMQKLVDKIETMETHIVSKGE